MQSSEASLSRLDKIKFELVTKNAGLQEKIVGLQKELSDVREEAREADLESQDREKDMLTQINKLERDLQKERKVGTTTSALYYFYYCLTCQ